MISNGHLQHQPSTLRSTVLRCCVIKEAIAENVRRSLVVVDAASAADTSTTCWKDEEVRCRIEDRNDCCISRAVGTRSFAAQAGS